MKNFLAMLIISIAFGASACAASVDPPAVWKSTTDAGTSDAVFDEPDCSATYPEITQACEQDKIPGRGLPFACATLPGGAPTDKVCKVGSDGWCCL